MKEEAVGMIEKKEEKKIKNELVDNIINILMMEFAKDFPKRKKWVAFLRDTQVYFRFFLLQIHNPLFSA